MSAHSQIITWSKDQSAWKRDALRRLLIGSFSPIDEDEILEFLKAEHKLVETKLTPIPLAAEHIPSPTGSADQVALLAVANAQNANRLAPDQRLPFARSGITLVYGDNGSGKSGYARILKKACRARMPEAIINNVFDAKAPKEPATADIIVAIGPEAKEETLKWEDGKPSSSVLARIAVFDNKCAAVYVDAENQLTFVPYNLDCFERLASLCDRLKERLAKEQGALQRTVAIPVLVLPEGTAAHAFLSSLGIKTDAEVDAATAWTDKDAAREKELGGLITEPQKQALALRNLYAQTKAVRDSIAVAAPFLSKDGIETLRAKKAALQATTKAAELAAVEAFAKEPLPGVGTSPWRILYEAARAYSEEEAYKGVPFPALEDNSRCVLCQQVLSDEGKDRIRRFDAFVRGEATKKADEAKAAWDAAIKVFRDATSKLVAMSPALDPLLKAENAAVHQALSTFLTEALTLRSQIEKTVIGDIAEPLPMPPTLDLGQVDVFLTSLNASAAAADAAVKDETAIALQKELAELQARHQLHLNKTQVLQRIGELRTLKKLEAAIKACVTTGISKKGTELLKEHVTGEFDTALADERKGLGVDGIPLRLDGRSPKGAPSHKLKLDQTTYSGNTSAILSEGEHRAVALAAFLAEQTMIAGKAPIIIDDPVSSLDHERRHKVAHRLIEEAKTRQVIIFTHDLLFYMDANFIATEKGVSLEKVGIRRGPKGFGTIDPEGDPWTAKTLGRRRTWLEQQHVKLKKLHAEAKTDDYEKETRFFYDRLRETWERLIEEGLFANVIVRYRRGVETKRLGSAVLDDAMVMRVFNGMTAISEYTAHDRPAAAGATWPDPDTVKGHLDDLIACQATIEAESKTVTKRREKLEKPPKLEKAPAE